MAKSECDSDEKQEGCGCSCHTGGNCCSCCRCSGGASRGGSCGCHSGWLGALALIAVGALVMLATKGGACGGGHGQRPGGCCCH